MKNWFLKKLNTDNDLPHVLIGEQEVFDMVQQDKIHHFIKSEIFESGEYFTCINPDKEEALLNTDFNSHGDRQGGSGYELGLTFKAGMIRPYEGTVIMFGAKSGNGVYAQYLRRATEEEIAKVKKNG